MSRAKTSVEIWRVARVDFRERGSSMKSSKGWALGGVVGVAFGLMPAVATAQSGAVVATRDFPLPPGHKSALVTKSMPTLAPGEYGTDIDNENNANTHVADGDMDVYLFNTNAITPIEYDIILPAGSAGKAGALRMDVYDVDAVSGEVDIVYVNGLRVGTLNGADGQWGVNIFSIPPNVLKDGRNLVKIYVDAARPGQGLWAVQVDWGIIKLPATNAAPDITRCWTAPVSQNQGNYVNFFAEANGVFDSVKVLVAGQTVSLTDPDKDKVWSGQWLIPTSVAKNAYALRWVGYRGTTAFSSCPTLKIK
jgi:hypothetical protein